jgi:hypothetical protein
MAFLLIFRADKGAFVEAEALDKLGFIGVRNLQRNSMLGAAIAGHFHWNGDEVLIELNSDLQTFSVSDSSPAGFEFAVRLQTQFNDPLRIVDEAYSFDLELKSFSTADQLQDAIRSVGM